MIERVPRAVNAINVPDVFCSFYTVISAVTVHSSAALPCKRFVSKRLCSVNNSSIQFIV